MCAAMGPGTASASERGARSPGRITRVCLKTKGLRVRWQDGKMEHMKRHEISEKQWNRIRDKFPPEKKPQGGRPGKSNREMLNGILYWLNTGIPWRDLPERFGPWQSVYSRFRAWTKAGIWEDILTALIEQDLVDETTLMLDSTTIKVHQHASGVKKGDITRKPDGAEGA